MSSTSLPTPTDQNSVEVFDSNESRWLVKSRVFKESEMQSIHEIEAKVYAQAKLQFGFIAVAYCSGLGALFRGYYTQNYQVTSAGAGLFSLSILAIHHIFSSIRRVLDINKQRIDEINTLTTVEGLQIIRDAIITTRPRPRYPINLARSGVLSEEIYNRMIQFGLEYQKLNPEYKQSFELSESQNQHINEFLVRWNPFIIELGKNIPDPKLY